VPEERPTAVLIFSDESEIPVTRLEVLSPANKPPGRFYTQYIYNREQTFLSEIALVEIDFIHERSPVHPRIPSYAQRQPNAFPYHILVTAPNNAQDEYQHKWVTSVYGFGVLDVIPSVVIPLYGQDRMSVDFGAVYQLIFDTQPLYRKRADLSKLPLNFHRYTDADQAAIRAYIERLAAGDPPDPAPDVT